MKKFFVKVHQQGFRTGTFYIEAPDENAAEILALDIKFSDPRIIWATNFQPYLGEYPIFGTVEVEET